MSLQIDDALRDGAQRTIARSGLLLIAVFVVFGFANTVLSQSLSNVIFDNLHRLFEQSVQQGPNPIDQSARSPTPFAIDLSLPALGVLSLLSILIAEAIHIVAIRVFASEYTDTVPAELASRRLGLATINGIVGGIVAGVFTLVGLVFLVVPGIYIALSLLFVRQEIAVADENFIDALAGSWGLTEGNRWELLGLALIVLVINAIAGSPAIALGFVDETLGTILSTILGALTSVFAIAVITRAYEQLRQERDAKLGLEDEGEPDEAGGTWGAGDDGV
ncbi:MAG: hypothetical protein ABEI77_04620 [Halorientalis sp.]